MTSRERAAAVQRSVIAGLLSWILPGAGHWYLGLRSFGLVFFAAVSAPYLIGLAFGGVIGAVNLATNPWLLLAETGVAGYTAPALMASRVLDREVLSEINYPRVPDQLTDAVGYDAYLRAATRRGYMSYFPEADVAQIYLATAGLLNLLVILDAIARAQTGLPTLQRELRLAEQRAQAEAGK